MIVDLLSILSIVGIWPRYIEPRLLSVSTLIWKLEPNQAHLDNLKILHLTDLHFHQKKSQKYLDKIIRKISKQRPDLILFTGDFICYGRLEDEERLKKFLQRLTAPLGCYCSFGNHDYSRYVSRNLKGIYDTLVPPKPLAGLTRGLKILFSQENLQTFVSERALAVTHHEGLCKLLKETPFKLLENETVTLPIGLNLTGLGDMALGRCRPETAFSGYDPNLPGIVLSHNPDTFPRLLSFPGNWILSGHTHGEQIHFPWPFRRFSQKLARLENSEYTRGLYTLKNNKKLYVNRGMGGHKPFRFCSIPEICILKTSIK